MIRMKSFFLGITITSIIWALIIYFYIIRTENNHKKYYNNSNDIKNRLPERHRLISRLNNNYNDVNSLKLLRKHNINDNNNNNQVLSETNLINDNPIDDDFKDKPDVKWYNTAIQLMASSSDSKSLISLGMINNPEDKLIKDNGYKKHAFNLLISNRIGFRRQIPDTRNGLCKTSQSLTPISDLPMASVIICFYNEAFSTLLRTVYSVIDRTNNKLLNEIILVDDFSDDAEIKEKLIEFVYDKLPNKVKLIRTPERAGLIRARMFGAHHATGQVLVFLDSHCEVNIDWLQPLLSRIHENRTTVVCPVIDIINANTFEYTASPIVKGGFNWGLHFKWDSVPHFGLQTKMDYIKPISSPTMAGGLFAIDRNYFYEMGEYDRGMDIWGGENLEISFRIWLCGGRLEIIPCSRVGHVFRQRRPYGSPTGEDTLTYNSLRVAHVWMDEYKKFFFETRPDVINKSYGDISERVKLRQNLNCSSFKWYVKNVYPDLRLPSPKEDLEKRRKAIKEKMTHNKKDNNNNNNVMVRKAPKIINKYLIQLSDTKLCIESESEISYKGSKLLLQKCSKIRRQLWYETAKHDLRLGQKLCLDSGEKYPHLSKCHEMGGTQDWKHSGTSNTPLYNLAAGLCLGVENQLIGEYVIMSLCNSEDSRKWNLIPK